MVAPGAEFPYDAPTLFITWSEASLMMKQVTRLTLALLLCLNFTVVFPRDNYPRLTVLDALHYRIHLDLKETGNEISAETEILLAFNGDGVKEVALDLAGLS